MKKHICRIRLLIRAVLPAALLCVALFPVKARAASVAAATIPVSVTVEGEEGTPEADIPTETYTFVLEAVTENAPLPAETAVTITGAGSASFSIDYGKVGVYQYKITQDAAALTGDNSACNDRGSYDDTVYYVTVSVISANDGSIGTVVAVHEGSTDGAKCAELVFTNTYVPDDSEEPSDPDEPGDSDEPSDPDEPDDPETPDYTPSPQTGDAANIALYAVVLIAAAAAIVALLIFRKKK